MTQTGEEIVGLDGKMLFAVVVLKLCLVHARIHGSHLLHGNSCKEVYHKKGQKTSFDSYPGAFHFLTLLAKGDRSRRRKMVE